MDFEVLSTLFILSQTEAYLRRPKDIHKRIPTLSRDYFYKSLYKLRDNGYIEQKRESRRNENSGQFLSQLYAVTSKGEKLVKEFIEELENMNEKVLYGYF